MARSAGDIRQFSRTSDKVLPYLMGQFRGLPVWDIDEKVWFGSPAGWVVENRALVREDVEIACGRIGRFVRRTPVARVTWDSSGR